MSAVDAQRPRRGLQPVSWLVLVIVVGLTVAGTFAVRSVVHDQERRLLKQRTEEAGVYLGGVIRSTELGLLSRLVTSSDRAVEIAQFPQLAQQLQAAAREASPSKTAPYEFAALIDVADAAPTVISAYGSGGDLRVGSQLSGEPLAAVTAAAQAGSHGQTGFSLTKAFTREGKTHLGIVFIPPFTSHVGVYTESSFDPFSATQAPSGAPFSELVAEVYAVPTRERGQLLISSVPESQYPLKGLTASYISDIGAGTKWLLVCKSRQPLVGSVAELTPWGMLIGGLLASLLIAWTVEVLARRRRYALDLVAERTAELQDSLTKLSAAQQQLIRSERLAAIGELASTVGHELRNPLGVLSNALYLIRADLGPDASERAQRHLATADREVSAASLIVSDLLEFARAREPAPVEFDVDELIDEVLTVSPPPSGITVERVKPEHPVTISADRDQMRQVVLNLVGNAEQAMDDGGTLRLSVEQPDGAVRIVVSDTGPGMSDEVKSQIFEPFFTTKARGVGLGLAVTRRIVEAHGGDIEVSSVEGEGASFTVTLPRVALPRQRTDALAPEVSR